MTFSLNNCIPFYHASKSIELLAFGTLALVLFFTIYLEKNLRWKIKLAPKSGVNVMSKFKSIESLPGPKPFPLKLIGNLFQLPGAKNMIPTCFNWCNKYGPCFRLTLLKQDFVVISSPSLAQVTKHIIKHSIKSGRDLTF